MLPEQVDQYFSTARERYRIWLQRQNHIPPPWTKDPVLAKWKFCNVHREHDKTTIWYSDNVRFPLVVGLPLSPASQTFAERKLRLIEATIAFRWFNRIETGRKIKDLLLNGWDSAKAYQKLRKTRPVVTGAFMVKTPNGKSKLRGLLWCIEQAREELPNIVSAWTTLENTHTSLCTLPYIGRFTAYEICMDLRYSPILAGASDTLTWAAAGPGSTKGLSRLHGKKFKAYSSTDQQQMREMMQELVALSKIERNWPQAWRPWEMNEAERWSCEFEKYMRVAVDGKLMKQRYVPK